MLKKGVKFKWLDIHEKEFLDIKNELSLAKSLVFPNFYQEFIIKCDSSSYGIGSLAKQDLGVIYYYSYKLNNNEISYSINEKEMISIVKVFKMLASHFTRPKNRYND